jgi:hypothetical protein
VFQPKKEAYGAREVFGFTNEHTIDTFVKPGRKYFNMDNIFGRPVSFLRKDDAIAHARDVLKMEMEMGINGSGSTYQEYKLDDGQGMTHGTVMDKFGILIRLVSIVKSILPIADT